jgi:hypothetical protein
MFHFYDPLPKSDDVTASAAVNECGNCGKACETLTWLEGWNFDACDACAEEAAREDEREAVPFCKQCFSDVDDPRDLNRAGMCAVCAREESREFWLNVRAEGRY